MDWDHCVGSGCSHCQPGNQGSLAMFLEDMRLVFSVILGVGVLMGLLNWFDRARAESYQAGINAERVRRFRAMMYLTRRRCAAMKT